MLALARKNWTGEMPNELYKTVALQNGYAVPPAYLGLGFNIRGPGIVNTQLGTLTSEGTFAGLTIPTSGSLGWHYGTDRWPEGEFLRYRIVAIHGARSHSTQTSR